MGNRAVISFDENDNATGVYLHWNGGPESVLAFLAAAKVLDLTIKERRFSRGDSIMRVEDLAPEDVLRYEGIKDECIEVNRELFKE